MKKANIEYYDKKIKFNKHKNNVAINIHLGKLNKEELKKAIDELFDEAIKIRMNYSKG